MSTSTLIEFTVVFAFLTVLFAHFLRLRQKHLNSLQDWTRPEDERT